MLGQPLFRVLVLRPLVFKAWRLGLQHLGEAMDGKLVRVYRYFHMDPWRLLNSWRVLFVPSPSSHDLIGVLNWADIPYLWEFQLLGVSAGGHRLKSMVLEQLLLFANNWLWALESFLLTSVNSLIVMLRDLQMALNSEPLSLNITERVKGTRLYEFLVCV